MHVMHRRYMSHITITCILYELQAMHMLLVIKKCRNPPFPTSLLCVPTYRRRTAISISADKVITPISSHIRGEKTKMCNNRNVVLSKAQRRITTNQSRMKTRPTWKIVIGA